MGNGYFYRSRTAEHRFQTVSREQVEVQRPDSRGRGENRWHRTEHLCRGLATDIFSQNQQCLIYHEPVKDGREIRIGSNLEEDHAEEITAWYEISHYCRKRYGEYAFPGLCLPHCLL